MKRLLLASLVVVLYVLHQDWWNWTTPYPLVLGFVPIGLFYHVCYTLAAAALMAVLVALAWPDHLEAEARERSEAAE